MGEMSFQGISGCQTEAIRQSSVRRYSILPDCAVKISWNCVKMVNKRMAYVWKGDSQGVEDHVIIEYNSRDKVLANSRSGSDQ